MDLINYKSKYLKYKSKYRELLKQLGGNVNIIKMQIVLYNCNDIINPTNFLSILKENHGFIIIHFSDSSIKVLWYNLNKSKKGENIYTLKLDTYEKFLKHILELYELAPEFNSLVLQTCGYTEFMPIHILKQEDMDSICKESKEQDDINQKLYKLSSSEGFITNYKRGNLLKKRKKFSDQRLEQLKNLLDKNKKKKVQQQNVEPSDIIDIFKYKFLDSYKKLDNDDTLKLFTLFIIIKKNTPILFKQVYTAFKKANDFRIENMKSQLASKETQISNKKEQIRILDLKLSTSTQSSLKSMFSNMLKETSEYKEYKQLLKEKEKLSKEQEQLSKEYELLLEEDAKLRKQLELDISTAIKKYFIIELESMKKKVTIAIKTDTEFLQACDQEIKNILQKPNKLTSVEKAAAEKAAAEKAAAEFNKLFTDFTQKNNMKESMINELSKKLVLLPLDKRLNNLNEIIQNYNVLKADKQAKVEKAAAEKAAAEKAAAEKAHAAQIKANAETAAAARKVNTVRSTGLTLNELSLRNLGALHNINQRPILVGGKKYYHIKKNKKDKESKDK